MDASSQGCQILAQAPPRFQASVPCSFWELDRYFLISASWTFLLTRHATLNSTDSRLFYSYKQQPTGTLPTDMRGLSSSLRRQGMSADYETGQQLSFFLCETRSHVAQAGLKLFMESRMTKLLILLPPPPKCCDYRYL